ncbi:hypothetical protein BH11PSE11_BH11PSE11_14090 [soil metagenome]
MPAKTSPLQLGEQASNFYSSQPSGSKAAIRLGEKHALAISLGKELTHPPLRQLAAVGEVGADSPNDGRRQIAGERKNLGVFVTALKAGLMPSQSGIVTTLQLNARTLLHACSIDMIVDMPPSA